VEVSALLEPVKRRLTSGAHVSSSLATVGVIVKGLSVQVGFATGGLGESGVEGNTSEEGPGVGELGRLEEDNSLVVVGSHRSFSIHGQRVKFVMIKLEGIEEEIGLFVDVGSPRLVDDIVSDDILVICESLRDDTPIVHHLVLNAVLVLIEGLKGGCNFGGCVKLIEVKLGAR